MLIGLDSGKLFSYNFFSPLIVLERLNVVEENQEFTLNYVPVISNSEKVYQDSILYQKNLDYTINYQSGKIIFFQPVSNIFIEYKKYPEAVQRRFFLFEEQEYSADKKVKIPQRINPIFSNTTRLQISGSKTIAVSVSRNEEFSLDQSLFLKMDGELSDNLNIEAQLSDSQSPITPEGASREISSLDKIFLRLYSSSYELAFGDLEVEYQDTEFMNYAPKFEGLKATWQRRNQYQAALAISKGKTTTVQFAGVEAKQGPYYLATGSGELIQVVAGTEKVFLNGNVMNRGDDYTIDYAEGSISFASHHFISANSIIQVTFQYSDEYYRQNMYLASSKVQISEKFSMRSFLVIQNDDKDNPLLDEFTPDDISVLQNAGDGEVWGSGVYEVEDGDYILHEDGYYVFVGNDSTTTGEYNIHFEFVGFNQGDYDWLENENYYIFAGAAQGDFLPVRSLIPPQRKENYDVILSYESGNFLASAEAIYTSFDQNTYSPIDDADNNGFAAKISLKYLPAIERIKPEFSVNYRQIGNHLNTFAELSDPLANYEAIQIPDTLANSTWNVRLRFQIDDIVSPAFSYSNTRSPDFADQDYYEFTGNSRQFKFVPAANYRFAHLERDYENGQTHNFDLHILDGSYGCNIIRMKGFYRNKRTVQTNQESALNLQNENWQFGLQTAKIKKFSSEVFLKKEYQKAKIDTSLTSEIDETIYTAGMNSMFSFQQLSAKIQYSHRQIYDDKNEKNTNFDLAEMNSSGSFWKNAISFSSVYAFKNVEFYPKLRELQFIGSGMGSYDEDSLYVGLGEGDYEWKIVQIDYDNPQMSVEVNANFNLNLNPGQVTNTVLNRIRTETNLQVSENSKAADKRKIYLLDPDILMNENTTLFGRKMQQQTVWLNIIKNKLNTKIRYKNEDILDNRYNEVSEKTEKTNWETNLRIRAIPNTNLELIWEKSEVEESRYQSFSEISSYVLEIRNQLNRNANLKSALEYGREAGRKNDQTQSYQIESYQIAETLTYFPGSKYRFFGKVSWKRNNRSGSEFLSFLDDKKDGNIFKWNLSLDYRVSSITSARMEYSGEIYPAKDTEHKISLEVKAEF